MSSCNSSAVKSRLARPFARRSSALPRGSQFRQSVAATSTGGTCGDAIVAASPRISSPSEGWFGVGGEQSPTAGLTVAYGAAPWPSNPSDRNARSTSGIRAQAADGAWSGFVSGCAGLVRRASSPSGSRGVYIARARKPTGMTSSSPPSGTRAARVTDYLGTPVAWRPPRTSCPPWKVWPPVGPAHRCGGPVDGHTVRVPSHVRRSGDEGRPLRLAHLRQFAVVFEGQDAFFPWFFEDGTADLENIVPR